MILKGLIVLNLICFTLSAKIYQSESDYWASVAANKNDQSNNNNNDFLKLLFPGNITNKQLKTMHVGSLEPFWLHFENNEEFKASILAHFAKFIN